MKIIQESLDKTGLWKGEYIALKKDKSTFNAYGLATIVTNDKGEKFGYQSAVLDISQRKQTEESLKYQLNIEALALDISSEFMNLHFNKIDEGINKALEKLANHCGAVRSSLLVFSKSCSIFSGRLTQ